MEPRPTSQIHVTASQISRFEELQRANAHMLVTKDINMETSQQGFMFVVEKPGRWPRSRELKLREQLKEGRLILKGLQRTGHSRKCQFATQFPGCYIVAVGRPRRDRFNFLLFV